jgi:hypothetical protein
VARSLADSVREMRANRIRAVVINASNPLDQIYVLEYLRSELPDVRVVTTGADELELGRPNFVDLTGTLTITGLPPLTGLTDTSRVNGEQEKAEAVTTKRLTTFKSSRQEGEYLGVASLLDPNQSAGAPSHPAPCYTMSVVTESGFRLLPYLLDDEKDGQPTFPCTMDASRSHSFAMSLTMLGSSVAPKSFLCFLGFLVVLNIIHFWCVAASRRGVDRWFSYPRRLLASSEPTRLYLLFATNNQLVLLNTLGTALGYASWSATGRHLDQDPWLVSLLCCVGPLAAVTLAFSGYLLFRFRVSMNKPDVKLKGRNWWQMTLAVAYLLTSAWMLYSLPALRLSNNIFLARITSLSDGLSPVIPIAAIMLGYFLWGCMQLKRLAWAASRKADLGGSTNVEKDFEYRVGTLSANLEVLVPTKQGFMTMGVPFCVVLAFLLWNSLNGFEGTGFRIWLAVWGVIMLLSTVMITCYHAWSIWADLQKLLEWLEITPLRDNFEQFGNDGLLQIKIWELIKPDRSFRVLSRTVESIRKLDGSDSPNALTATRRLQSLQRKEVTHKQLVRRQIEKMSEVLNVHMEDAIATLQEDLPKYRCYLALRVIALIRYAMLHIGILICFVAYGYVLAVISVMFYAFEGRRSLNVLVVTTFVALLIWIGRMMAQFERNGMLSRLQGTTPGQVSYGQLALHLMSVGGLPLLAIVTSQFPAISSFAFSFFRPVLGALH